MPRLPERTDADGGLTEDSLVAALRAICEPEDGTFAPPRRVALGIGDDAAAWQPSRSHLSVITSDALVDGVHFLSDAMEAGAIGHRAMAANLSDLAAMGARPILATVVLGVTRATTQPWILEVYREMARLGARFGLRIVGGDIVRVPAATFSLTLVGEVARGRLKRRAGGRPGDVLAVTGPLGASRAGLELTLRPRAVDAAMQAAAMRSFAMPEPRVREGRWLAASANVHAMMDCSDGLSTDVARLARASGCGAELTAVPVAEAARVVAAAAGDDGLRYALDGGEDFELIVAVAPRAFAHLSRAFAARFGTALHRIGRLTEAAGVRLVDAAGSHPLEAGGFDHFATSES